MALRFISPVHKALRQISLYLSERMGEFNISPGEGHLLSYLHSYSPSAIGELLRVFGLKKSTLTSMLNRLVERGLVTREVNPEDRRSFLIGLTPAGSELAQRVNRPVDELEEEIGKRVGDEELRGFDSVMSAIAEATAVEVRESQPPQSVTIRGEE